MKSLFLAALLLAASVPAVLHAGPVDINSADAQTLSEELKGIGLSKAEAIVAYRKKHGPFKHVEDLTLVKGIGERTVEENRSELRLSTPAKP